MKDELNNNYEDEESSYKNIPEPKKLTHLDISTVFDPKSGEQISIEKAIKLGFYNTKQEIYTDTKNDLIATLFRLDNLGFCSSTTIRRSSE